MTEDGIVDLDQTCGETKKKTEWNYMTDQQRIEIEWKTTWLWKTLDDRSNSSANHAARHFVAELEGWMKKIEIVLSSSCTAPLDFTLHDAKHSYRVANRMEHLMTAECRDSLSDYELALLLLSAYGHDIGMTPERRKVQDHYHHLFAPDETPLDPGEVIQFQKFLDDYDDEPITLPICQGTPTVGELNLADELTAYYVREKHNDWSAEWIRGNLHGQLHDFSDSRETLILLCQSHHFSFDRLRHIDFDPRLVGGSQPQILHLRFLANILRLADILENDPERTPEVIFRHRDILERERSVIHWQKDHDLIIDVQQDRIFFQARPRSAKIHKALLQLADWIDYELRGIAEFGESLPSVFKVGVQQIRREWHIAPGVRRRIEPVGGSYEYIEGAFRPNTKRILQLLSGLQLYGDAFSAIRELVQNAFDAVREKIARRRLQPRIKDRANPALEKQFGDEECVVFKIERRVDEGSGCDQVWIVCEDSGVGLTKTIISEHFLVNGQSRRHDLVKLERDCEMAGFRLGRTGQFGIGVLSYFMLADEVQIRTTRSQACGDGDGPGWCFKINGISDFGELQRESISPFPHGGSAVAWKLREDFGRSMSRESCEHILRYLQQTLVHVPCSFSFRIEGFEGEALLWERDTGWTSIVQEELRVQVGEWPQAENVKWSPEYLLSESEVIEQRRLVDIYSIALTEARKASRCEMRDLNLPDGLGRLQLTVFYFDLPRGRSLTYPILDESGNYRQLPDNAGDRERRGFKFSVARVEAWKGMACGIYAWDRDKDIPSYDVCGYKLDIVGAKEGLVSVDRMMCQLPPEQYRSIREFVESKKAEFLNEIFQFENRGFYRDINLWAVSDRLLLDEQSGWFVFRGGTIALQEISFPAIATNQGRGLMDRKVIDSAGRSVMELERRENHLSVVQQRQIWPNPSHIKVLNFSVRRGLSLDPDRRMLVPVAYWESAPSSKMDGVMFPRDWRAVVGIKLEDLYLNRSHPLLARFTSVEMELMSKDITDLIRKGAAKVNLADVKNVSGEREAAEFLMRAVFAFSIWKKWEHFRRDHAADVERLWNLAAAWAGVEGAQLNICCLNGNQVFTLGSGGVALNKSSKEAQEFMVLSESEWTIREQPIADDL